MFTEENKRQIDSVRKKYPNPQAALLPILWIAQEQDGWISEEAMVQIGDMLELPYGHILGVVTFYSMMKTKPHGKFQIEVCTNVSCMLRGSDQILEKVKAVTGTAAGSTSTDGKWTVTEAECMGACGGAPMIAIGEEYYENLSPEKTEEILKKL